MNNPKTREGSTPAPEQSPREFWRDVGEGYRIICHVSDAGDWAAILQTIAVEIAPLLQRCDRPARILDLGAGTGGPSATIAKLLLTRYNLRTQWTLVEPDMGARECCGYAFPSTSGTPSVGTIYASISDVPLGERHDVGLMIHSSYEVRNIDIAIRELSARLHACGVIICLSLPEDSPFFVIGQNYFGCAEQLMLSLAAVGYDVRSYRLVSRIHMLPEVLKNPSAVASIKAFANGNHLTNDQFLRLARTHWGKEVDFGDNLIVASRKH